MTADYKSIDIRCCNPWWAGGGAKEFFDDAMVFSLGLNLTCHGKIVADGVVQFRATGTEDAIKKMSHFCCLSVPGGHVEMIPVVPDAKTATFGRTDNPSAMLYRAGAILGVIEATFSDDGMEYGADSDDLYGALQAVKDLIVEANSNILNDIRDGAYRRVDETATRPKPTIVPFAPNGDKDPPTPPKAA